MNGFEKKMNFAIKNKPCYITACVDNKLTCPECGWKDKD